MSKFSGRGHTVRPPRGPTSTSGPARTAEGGVGFVKDPCTALFTLAVTNMVGETTFYESADVRDKRFVGLVHEVAVTDPGFIVGMVPWLRNTAGMRSASIVMAAEFVAARLTADEDAAPLPGGVTLRKVVDSAISRPDEPAEMLGYWLSMYGRKVPQPIKRGVADGAARLYNESSALKYDGGSRAVRMGDVIELTHPTPSQTVEGPGFQSALFKHLLDKRHGHFEPTEEALSALHGAGLTKLCSAYGLDRIPEGDRVDWFRAATENRTVQSTLKEAGYTWERLAGWLPGGMTAAAWESILPSMGYMALLRNLRNLEQAGVPDEILDAVGAKLCDPDEVAKSMQFPYRFWSAWKATGSMFFARPLEKALDLSCSNIPKFRGQTLVLIDTSLSMDAPVSGRSDIMRWEAAALFGAAVAHRSGARLVMYADTWKEIPVQRSVIRTVEAIKAELGKVGSGTQTWPCALEAFNKLGPFDRIMAFTDEQNHPARAEAGQLRGFILDPTGPYRGLGATRYRNGILPAVTLPDVPVYAWDLAGAAVSSTDTEVRNRFLLGGFSDASFKVVPLLEAGRDAGWPWEIPG